MAYDPKDPADKKIVDDLIAAALAEANEEHEAAVAGLKAKNKELLGKIKSGEGADPKELERLEGEVATLQQQIKDSTKAIKTLTKERDEATTARDTEASYARNMTVNSELTAALTGAKVAPEFHAGAKALLSGSKIELRDVEGGERKAFVGDKPLADFVKEWSQGDEGKHYIAAPRNGGGGSSGAQGGTGKTMARADYEAMNAQNPGGAAAFFAEGGTIEG